MQNNLLRGKLLRRILSNFQPLADDRNSNVRVIYTCHLQKNKVSEKWSTYIQSPLCYFTEISKMLTKYAQRSWRRLYSVLS